jgi:hypothetical protein
MRGEGSMPCLNSTLFLSQHSPASEAAVKMEEWEAKLAEADLLIDRSREIVALQRSRIEKLRASGASTELSERMLAMFEEALVRRQVRRDELLRSAQIPRQFRPW